MVIPTTVRPSRTSMAATTELSTPPLMATAMGCSGMDGNPAKMRHARRDGLDQSIDLFHRVGTPQRKPHAGTGAIVSESDGLQDVRRRERATGTGRPCRHCEATQIERYHHGLTIDAVEINVARIGYAIPA